MHERRGGWRLGLIGAVGLGACAGPGAPSGAEGTTATPAAAADVSAPAQREALVFETRRFAFDVVRPEDQRRLRLEAEVPVPRGWTADPRANPVQTTLWAPGGAGSRITIAATCFGTCTAAKAAANLEGAAKLQADASPGATIIRDEVLTASPGVSTLPGARMRGFVIATTERGQLVGVGLQPEAETGFILACQADLRAPFGDEAAAIFDACAKMQVNVIDPTLPLAAERAERASLAVCPPAAKLSYRSTAAEGAPPGVVIGDIQTVLAVSTRAGLVELYLGDYPFTSVRESAAPLAPGQHRLRIGFDAGRLGGEVLSGILPARHGPVHIEASLASPAAVFTLAADQLEGQVELVARTRTAACGRFRLADSTHTLEGEFPVTLIRIGYAP